MTVDRTEPGGAGRRLRAQLSRGVAAVDRHPSAILLGAQLLALLAYPFFENTPAGRAALGTTGILVLLLALKMVHRTAGSHRVVVAAAIAIPAGAAYLLAVLGGMRWLLPWGMALEALFYFHAVACLVAYMLADRRATRDELFAAGATFTLLAWAFAYVFATCQMVQPACLSTGVDPNAPHTWTELLFFSFVLLSSTGLGNIAPVSPAAHAIASLEIFVGVMYLALVVSRLIGIAVTQRPR